MSTTPATESVASRTGSTPPSRPIDALVDAIVAESRRVDECLYRFLVLVREFDERAGWLEWGNSSCAEWLAWRCDLSMNAARERVRVAHALTDLPRVAAAFASGALSYSKVRALTRVTTALEEHELLSFAMTATAARVEERCRQMRNVTPASTGEARRAHAGRSLRSWQDRERQVTVVTVELPVEQAELVLGAIDRAVSLGRCEAGPEFGAVSWNAQRADALVEVATAYLDGRYPDGEAPDGQAVGACPDVGDGDVSDPARLVARARARRARSTAERYQVVVHVDEAALRGEPGGADLPLESVRRLLCDGSVVALSEDADGAPLDVGRKQRTVPLKLRRALWSRDRGCTFPGCKNTHFVDAHHVQHWAEGGETSLANTVLLCGAHHRLVHEGGFTIEPAGEGGSGGAWRFLRPDGRAVPACGYEAHVRALGVACSGATQVDGGPTDVAVPEENNRAHRRVSAGGSPWKVAEGAAPYGVVEPTSARTAVAGQQRAARCANFQDRTWIGAGNPEPHPRVVIRRSS